MDSNWKVMETKQINAKESVVAHVIQSVILTNQDGIAIQTDMCNQEVTGSISLFETECQHDSGVGNEMETGAKVNQICREVEKDINNDPVLQKGHLSAVTVAVSNDTSEDCASHQVTENVTQAYISQSGTFPELEEQKNVDLPKQTADAPQAMEVSYSCTSVDSLSDQCVDNEHEAQKGPDACVTAVPHPKGIQSSCAHTVRIKRKRDEGIKFSPTLTRNDEDKENLADEACIGSGEPKSSEKPRVVYIYNDEYLSLCDQMPRVPRRASMTHHLIGAYGLLQQMRLISPRYAREDELALFHSSDYLKMLRSLSEQADDEKYDEDAEMYGLTYDCPPYEGCYKYATYVAGATIKAAQCLMMGLCDVAINWPGGWHHAKRDEGSGFCYINDVVVAILKMRKKFERVLYVDLDLHHGDGVEDAFSATSKVMTVSFHKLSPGFFPGTGSLEDDGVGKGQGYTLNIPLADGIQDAQYCDTFKKVIELVRDAYKPEAVVCQCGADGLAGDPMDSFNLTPAALCCCVKMLQGWALPLLLVGGGGYNLANTSRCWTQITADVLGVKLPVEIPEHLYFTRYGPDYQLDVPAGNRANKNSQREIDEIIEYVKDVLQDIQS